MIQRIIMIVKKVGKIISMYELIFEYFGLLEKNPSEKLEFQIYLI